MKFFYLASKPNIEGFFEVHDKECGLIPDSLNRDYLGPFNNGREALRIASGKNPKSVLCTACCPVDTQPIIFSTKARSGVDKENQ